MAFEDLLLKYRPKNGVLDEEEDYDSIDPLAFQQGTFTGTMQGSRGIRSEPFTGTMPAKPPVSKPATAIRPSQSRQKAPSRRLPTKKPSRVIPAPNMDLGSTLNRPLQASSGQMSTPLNLPVTTGEGRVPAGDFTEPQETGPMAPKGLPLSDHEGRDRAQYFKEHPGYDENKGFWGGVKNFIRGGFTQAEANRSQGGPGDVGSSLGAFLRGGLRTRIDKPGIQQLEYEMKRKPEFMRQEEVRNTMRKRREEDESRAWQQESRERLRRGDEQNLKQGEIILKHLPLSQQLGDLNILHGINTANRNFELKKQDIEGDRERQQSQNQRDRAYEQWLESRMNEIGGDKTKAPKAEDLIDHEKNINNKRIGVSASKRGSPDYKVIIESLNNDIDSLVSNYPETYEKGWDAAGVPMLRRKAAR